MNRYGLIDKILIIYYKIKYYVLKCIIGKFLCWYRGYHVKWYGEWSSYHFHISGYKLCGCCDYQYRVVNGKEINKYEKFLDDIEDEPINKYRLINLK
jgi:hypothetical protein